MPHTRAMFDLLDRLTPEIREKAGQPRSMLYVGWRHDTKPWWYGTFGKNLGVETFGVLDIFSPNLDELEHRIWEGQYPGVQTFLGDIRKLDSLSIYRYDIVFWDHGPEHVPAADLRSTTRILEQHVGRCLIYCCPWGLWPQGESDGNRHEVHEDPVYPEQFRQLGLETYTTGECDQVREGELLGLLFR